MGEYRATTVGLDHFLTVVASKVKTEKGSDSK